ncbi:MAG: FHA domain-containing protein [Myxococcota bacterium]|nr:FHA domain-containing protein [Myxococcota bacterium]
MKGHRRIIIKRSKESYHKLTPKGTGPKAVCFSSDSITVEVYGKDLVQFGRDADFSDALIFVEPILPLVDHPENVDESLKISSAHFTIQRKDGGFLIKDSNSNNGTFVNGQRIQEPQALKKGDVIALASALKLQVESELPGLLLSRIGNEPNKYYLLLPANRWVPFNLGKPRDFSGSALVFCSEEDTLFLGNQSGSLSVEQHILEPREASCLSGKSGTVQVDGISWRWKSLE